VPIFSVLLYTEGFPKPIDHCCQSPASVSALFLDSKWLYVNRDLHVFADNQFLWLGQEKQNFRAYLIY